MSLFLIDPPETKDVEQWKAWMKKEAQARAQQKARETKRLPYAEDMGEISMAKINGRWVQRTRVGFSGESEQYTLEPVVDADQEMLVEQIKRRNEKVGNRGGKRPNRNRNQRRQKRELKRKGLGLVK